jgi:hypothetical protein
MPLLLAMAKHGSRCLLPAVLKAGSWALVNAVSCQSARRIDIVATQSALRGISGASTEDVDAINKVLPTQEPQQSSRQALLPSPTITHALRMDHRSWILSLE